MLAISPEIFGLEFLTGKNLPLDTATKILSFGRLKPGWHYGEGGPIGERAIDIALEIYWQFALASADDTDAFPGIDGEIMVTAYKGTEYVEVIVETDGTMSLAYEIDDEPVITPMEHRPADEILGTLAKVIKAIWSTSASYTEIILTPDHSKIASKVWHSKIPPKMEGHLWFSEHVWMHQEQASASMREYTIANG